MSKKSTQKKRHTKPCRYFQLNKCPHPADVCDFAHVFAPSSAPVERCTTMCRFYSISQCPNGPLCVYQHYDEARSSSTTDWGTSPSDTTDPIYGGYPAYGQVWPPSSFPPSNLAPFPPHVVESMLFAPPRSRDSIETATNSISSLDSDEMIVMTDDPQYPEHTHSHQSQVYIAEDSPIIHVPPFYPIGGVQVGPSGMISPIGTGPFDWGLAAGMANGAMKKPDLRPRSSTRSMSKQKAMAFKTKPCKFFNTERGCPNGNTCTFVHEEDRPGSPLPQPASPVKYPTLTDDSKNYYPITWRVIGGGVRVGMTRDDENRPPAYDTAESSEHTSTPHEKPHLPALKMMTRQRSNSIPSTPSNIQVKVDQLFPAESPGVL
ncbi:hypothetical protein CPB83DRAFT_527207 [Crepidotus variabilis]|uniref:C3H1-type domain-containing protein n=1 Tax=Crepidotus variabilis TaxID=179855 RepID=A0A9P6EQ76_9AGAR|nr:hypothetical protein CPB83DRAFT_527207 [Crepidotus variabilis]